MLVCFWVLTGNTKKNRMLCVVVVIYLCLLGGAYFDTRRGGKSDRNL